MLFNQQERHNSVINLEDPDNLEFNSGKVGHLYKTK